MSSFKSPIFPNTVIVRFPTQLCSDITNPITPPGPYYVSVVALAEANDSNLSGFTGHHGSQIMHDMCLAVYDGTSNIPSNRNELDTLAESMASAFWYWRSLSYDRSFNSVIAPTMDASIDTFRIDYNMDRCVSRMTSRPFNGEAEEFYHNGENCSRGPCGTIYIPTAQRSGNFIRFPKGRICIVNDTITIKTSSFDEVFICCVSSSTTSSSSEECPVHDCDECHGPGACQIRAEVKCLTSGEEAACDLLNGIYYLDHVSGCTWYAAEGRQPGSDIGTGGTMTLMYDEGSSQWKVTLVGNGYVAIFFSSFYICNEPDTPTNFSFQADDSTCGSGQEDSSGTHCDASLSLTPQVVSTGS